MTRSDVRSKPGRLPACFCFIVLAFALPSCDSLTVFVMDPAKIEIETAHYTFGEIESDEIAEDFVRVFNRGGSTLHISKVTTSCGCTQGEMLDAEIPPGGEGILRVTVDPKRFRGMESTKTLTLFSNDPDTPAIEIDVSATAMPEVEFVPKRLDFGEIPFGQGIEGTVRIRQLRKTPITFSSDLTGGNTFIVGEMTEVPESEWLLPDRAEYDLSVRVLPEARPGPHYVRFVRVGDLRARGIIVDARVVVAPRADLPAE